MARPKKRGLDYFPFDVDFFDDYKIMDLMNEYGPIGVSVYQIILSRVYKNGYYLDVPLDKLVSQIIRIIGNRWVKDKNFVLHVIQYCADIGLFNDALLTQSVITSVGIQRRYSEVTVRNKVDKSNYWLLDKKIDQEALISEPQNIVFVTKTQVNVAKTQINTSKKTQKESKLNESKLNERRAAFQLPCTNGNYAVTQEQIGTLQQAYKSIDVMQSLRKMFDYLKCHPNSQRPVDAIENRVIMWLQQDNEKAIAKSKQQSKQSDTSYDINSFKDYDIFD